MGSLIDASADVNKYYGGFRRETMGGALGALMNGIHAHSWVDGQSTIPSESPEAFNVLTAAGGRVHPQTMTLDYMHRTVDLGLLICQHVPPERHRDLFKRIELHVDTRNRSLEILANQEDAVNMLLDYGADAKARPRIRTSTRTALQYARGTRQRGQGAPASQPRRGRQQLSVASRRRGSSLPRRRGTATWWQSFLVAGRSSMRCLPGPTVCGACKGLPRVGGSI